MFQRRQNHWKTIDSNGIQEKTFQIIALKKLPLPSSSKTDKDIFDEGSSYLQPTFAFLILSYLWAG